MDKSKLDQKAQKLLAREIQSLEKMNHPNIIRLFEVSTPRNSPSINIITLVMKTSNC